MKQSINLYQFRDAFRDMGRMDNFSYEGLGILFESMEELADDTGHDTELDVIALCCEFSESDADEIADNYNIDTSDSITANEELSSGVQVTDEFREEFNAWLADFFGTEENEEIKADIVRDYLHENTYVCGETSDGSFIYQDF